MPPPPVAPVHPNCKPSVSPAWFPGGGKTNLAAALENLMWIIQVEYEHFGSSLQIRGYVKITEGPVATEGQVLAGLADGLEEILDVLDQAGVELDGFPEIDVRDRYGGPEMQICLKIHDVR